MNPFAAFRLPPVYRNLMSRCRPNQLGLRAGPSLQYTNVGCYHLRNPRHPTAYNKLEVGNERNIVVDGTDSRYTGRGLFLLLDGIGETVSYLATGGTGGGGSGDGALGNTLTSPHRILALNTGDTHTKVSTSLDIRSSTLSRHP